MNTKKIFLFLIIIVIGISIVSATEGNLSTDNDNLIIESAPTNTITENNNIEDTKTNIKDNNQQIKTINDNTNSQNNENISKTIKQDTTPKTIILNSTTFDEYVTNRTFNDNVNPGDTIDIQGLLDGEHFNLDIYKPLNIISSTHDAYITNILKTGRNEFIIHEGASGTNITGISFHNTYIGIHSAHNITFDNITATHNKMVGQGTGMFSVRSYSSNVIIKNSYFEGRNNGGHSVFVFHYAQNCLVENTTIKGSGNIGNLVYLTTYGGRPDNPAFGDNSTAPQEIVWDGNYNITFRNNFIFGRDCASAICYILAIEGCGHLFENNTIISTTSNTVKKQWNTDDIYLRNITFLNNILTDVGDNLTEHENITFINNTIFSEELLDINDDNYNEYGYMENNTLYINLTTDKPVRLWLSSISEVTLLHDLNVRSIHNLISKVNFQVETFNIKYLYAPRTIINCTGTGNISFSTMKALITNTDKCNITNNTIVNYDYLIESYENVGYKAVILNNAGNETNCSNNCIVSYNDTINAYDGYEVTSPLLSNDTRMYGNHAIYTGNDSVIMENNVPDSVNITVETTQKLLMSGSNVKVNVTYDDQPVTEGYVVVLLNGIPVTKENLTNGVLETVVTPKYLGNQILSVWYSIDGTYNYNNTELLEIEAIQFNTSVMLESNSVKVGEDISVKAIVVDQFDNTVNNGTLTFKVGQDEFNVTIIDGTAVFNATTNETWYTSGVQAILYQTDAYTQSISNKLTLEKGDALFDIRQRIVDDKLVVTVSVSDINGLPVSAGRIRFRGNVSSSPKIVDGCASLELPLANVTEGMTVTANFTNNNAFNTKFETITLTLNPPKITNVNIDEVVGKTNQLTTLTATITTDNQVPVSNGSVTFSAGGFSQTVSVEDGVATLSHIFTEKLNDTLTVIYTPISLDDYYGSVNTTTIIITKDSENVTLILSPITGKINEEVTITASIATKDNMPINEGQVTFTTTNYEETVNVINGMATITHTFTQTLNDILMATYTPENLEDYNPQTNTTTITIIEDNKELTLKINTTNFIIGQTNTITANIYLDDTIAIDINKGKVVFKVNGKTLKDTNGKVIYAKVINGTATIENYVVPSSWTKENTTIQAVYSGSTQLESLKSDKETITITKQAPAVTLTDMLASKGESIQINIQVTQGQTPINTGKIVVKINGKTLKDTNGKIIYATVNNGIATINYTIPSNMKVNNYNLTSVFISSDYERVENTVKLTIE